MVSLSSTDRSSTSSSNSNHFMYTSVVGIKSVGSHSKIYGLMQRDLMTRHVTWPELLNRCQKLDEVNCSICYEPVKCEPCDSGCVHDCNKVFHLKCLQRWVEYAPGERIVPAKSQCPICRQPLKMSMFGLQMIDIDSFPDLEKIPHFRCKKCQKIFSQEHATSRSGCSESTEIGPELCNGCVPGNFACPNCGLMMEHSGGCRLFACCLYGRDGCKGETCDHGSTSSVKFCGHKFVVPDHIQSSRSDGFHFVIYEHTQMYETTDIADWQVM